MARSSRCIEWRSCHAVGFHHQQLPCHEGPARNPTAHMRHTSCARRSFASWSFAGVRVQACLVYDAEARRVRAAQAHDLRAIDRRM